MKRDWINWQRRIICLPDSKTGAKSIFLSDASLDVLRDQLASDSGESAFVFPGRSSGHMINLRKSWVRAGETLMATLRRSLDLIE